MKSDFLHNLHDSETTYRKLYGTK